MLQFSDSQLGGRCAVDYSLMCTGMQTKSNKLHEMKFRTLTNKLNICNASDNHS